MVEELKGCNWIPVSDHNPEIDMSYPHGDEYFVKYKDGGYGVAKFCNYNIFWTYILSQEPWWRCPLHCEVEAWMPINEYKGECNEATDN